MILEIGRLKIEIWKFEDWKCGLVVWWLGGLVVWRLGGLVVWWFDGLVVWCLVVWKKELATLSNTLDA